MVSGVDTTFLLGYPVLTCSHLIYATVGEVTVLKWKRVICTKYDYKYLFIRNVRMAVLLSYYPHP